MAKKRKSFMERVQDNLTTIGKRNKAKKGSGGGGKYSTSAKFVKSK